MEIITGYRNEPHVASQEDRNASIAIFGGATCILKDIDSELAPTVVSANLIEISDGMLVAEGCTACIERGTSDSLIIENGAQGMQRIDLIVVRYTRNAGTAVEDMKLAVIKGTPSATDPAVPAHTTGLIADGDPVVDFPLYRVNISGISITSVERLVEITSVAELITDIQNRIGNVSMGTTATTLTGAIAEVRGKLPHHLEYTWQYTSIGIGHGLAYSDTKRIGVDGYTPIAIKGFRVLDNDTGGKHSGWCIIDKIWLYNNAMDFTIWNQHPSEQAVVKVQIKVAYVSDYAT